MVIVLLTKLKFLVSKSNVICASAGQALNYVIVIHVNALY